MATAMAGRCNFHSSRSSFYKNNGKAYCNTFSEDAYAVILAPAHAVLECASDDLPSEKLQGALSGAPNGKNLAGHASWLLLYDHVPGGGREFMELHSMR